MKSKDYNITMTVRDATDERFLRNSFRKGAKSKELYKLGEMCFDNPELMKKLDEEVLEDKSFLHGYQRGKSLALIKKLEEENSKKR